MGAGGMTGAYFMEKQFSRPGTIAWDEKQIGGLKHFWGLFREKRRLEKKKRGIL